MAGKIKFGINSINSRQVAGITYIQPLACQEFIKEPEAPADSAAWRGGNEPGKDIRRDCLDNALENEEIDGLVTKGKTEMIRDVPVCTVAFIKYTERAVDTLAATHMII